MNAVEAWSKTFVTVFVSFAIVFFAAVIVAMFARVAVFGWELVW